MHSAASFLQRFLTAVVPPEPLSIPPSSPPAVSTNPAVAPASPECSFLAIPLTQQAASFFREVCATHGETFSAFPLDPADVRDFVLSPAHTQHIPVAEKVLPELAALRQRMTVEGHSPKNPPLTQHEFWYVYFKLLEPYIQRHQRELSKMSQSPPSSPRGFIEKRTPRPAAPLPFVSCGRALSLAPIDRLSGFISTHLSLPASAPRAYKETAESRRTATMAVLQGVPQLCSQDRKQRLRHEGKPKNRRAFWKELLGLELFKESTELYYAASLVRTDDFTHVEPALFGSGELFRTADYLTIISPDPSPETGKSRWHDWDQILRLLAMDFGYRAFIPCLPDLVALLLGILEAPHEVYVAASLLVLRAAFQGGSEASGPPLFPVSRKAAGREGEVLEGLLSAHVPRLAQHFKEIFKYDLVSKFQKWMNRFFFGILPVPTALRIFDCFLAEGRTVLYRAGLIILQRAEHKLLKAKTELEVETELKLTGSYSWDTEAFLSEAFGVPIDPNCCQGIFEPELKVDDPFSALKQLDGEKKGGSGDMARRNAKSSELSHDSLLEDTISSLWMGSPRSKTPPAVLDSSSDDDSDEDEKKNESLMSGGPEDACGSLGKTNISSLLDDEQWKILATWLPASYRDQKAERIYTAEKDGFNTATLIRLAEGRSPLVIVVETGTKSLFGAFVPVELKSRGEHFYGTGEAFLFTFSPKPCVYEWTPDRNSFFFMVSNNCLSVGGGGEGPGLWLDEELNEGHSYRSETFQNEPLDEGRTEFWVKRVEAFGFAVDE